MPSYRYYKLININEYVFDLGIGVTNNILNEEKIQHIINEIKSKFLEFERIGYSEENIHSIIEQILNGVDISDIWELNIEDKIIIVSTVL